MKSKVVRLLIPAAMLIINIMEFMKYGSNLLIIIAIILSLSWLALEILTMKGK